MSELSELFERNHSRHRCRVCREIEEDRDALAKRVEELREILRHAYAWMATDGCDCGTDEPGSCALCETERVLKIATRRAGRAS